MRVIAQLADASVVQVEKIPEQDVPKNISGKFVVPLPEMAAVDVTSSSYVLPVDGGDITSLAMAAMLVQYPMYEYVIFNPFLSAADVADLDLAGTLSITGDMTRAFTGRGSGLLPTGVAPNSVGLLALNDRVSPSRPGLLVTDTIDVSVITSGVGADEVMVWWKIYGLDTTEDVTSSYGETAGVNEPASRTIAELDQEPFGLDVFVSNDDGVSWTQVYRLTPTDLAVFGSQFRLAFRSMRTDRVYLAAYALMI